MMNSRLTFVFGAIACLLASSCKAERCDTRSQLEKLGLSHFFNDDKEPQKILLLLPKQVVDLEIESAKKVMMCGVFVKNGYDLHVRHKGNLVSLSDGSGTQLSTWHSASASVDASSGKAKLKIKNLSDEQITVIVYTLK